MLAGTWRILTVRQSAAGIRAGRRDTMRRNPLGGKYQTERVAPVTQRRLARARCACMFYWRLWRRRTGPARHFHGLRRACRRLRSQPACIKPVTCRPPPTTHTIRSPPAPEARFADTLPFCTLISHAYATSFTRKETTAATSALEMSCRHVSRGKFKWRCGNLPPHYWNATATDVVMGVTIINLTLIILPPTSTKSFSTLNFL